MHDEAPADVENDPAEHSLHEEDPLADAYLPGAQLVQLLLPPLAEKVPLEQALHSEDPAAEK